MKFGKKCLRSAIYPFSRPFYRWARVPVMKIAFPRCIAAEISWRGNAVKVNRIVSWVQQVYVRHQNYWNRQHHNYSISDSRVIDALDSTEILETTWCIADLLGRRVQSERGVLENDGVFQFSRWRFAWSVVINFVEWYELKLPLYSTIRQQK